MKTVIVAEGTSATVRCEVRGNRPVEVIWKRNSTLVQLPTTTAAQAQTHTHTTSDFQEKNLRLAQKVIEVNSTVLSAQLQIKSSELADSGNYLCIASNQYGRDEDSIILQVKGK